MTSPRTWPTSRCAVCPWSIRASAWSESCRSPTSRWPKARWAPPTRCAASRSRGATTRSELIYRADGLGVVTRSHLWNDPRGCESSKADRTRTAPLPCLRQRLWAYAGYARRAPPFAVLVTLAGCGASVDSEQLRLCRQVIPALNPDGSEIREMRYAPSTLGQVGVRID